MHFPSKLVSSFLIPFGSVLIAAVALLASTTPIPQWAVAVVVTYLAVAMVISLAYPARKLRIAFQRKRIIQKAARKFYAALVETTGQMSEQVNFHRVNTVANLSQEVSSLVGEQAHQVPVEALRLARSWMETIHRRVDPKSHADFVALARELSAFVSEYHYLCRRVHESIISLISKGLIPEQRLPQVRQQWNLARERQMSLVTSWEQLTKKINGALGERLCNDYYEPLKML